jgi:FkbM family methyltransferase
MPGIGDLMSDAALNLRCCIKRSAVVGGVRLPLSRISTAMKRAIVTQVYESNELRIVASTLELGDSVLECGSGIGLLSAYCARKIGGPSVRTYEANPYMEELIRKTYALNEVTPILTMGAIGPRRGQLTLHVRKNFWASSSHDRRAPGSLAHISVPMYSLDDEIKAHKPSYLFVDIEGGEEQLAGCGQLPGVRKLMTEVHPDLIGKSALAGYLNWIRDLGFALDPRLSTQHELFFARA